mmetsp:Transcript_15268/g.37465  ORF Transcript_15268/g.37465 Transcript_15268/m.37465 type:complete len:309 (-) Transcript_15268:1448-2374(-)
MPFDSLSARWSCKRTRILEICHVLWEELKQVQRKSSVVSHTLCIWKNLLQSVGARECRVIRETFDNHDPDNSEIRTVEVNEMHFEGEASGVKCVLGGGMHVHVDELVRPPADLHAVAVEAGEHERLAVVRHLDVGRALVLKSDGGAGARDRSPGVDVDGGLSRAGSADLPGRVEAGPSPGPPVLLIVVWRRGRRRAEEDLALHHGAPPLVLVGALHCAPRGGRVSEGNDAAVQRLDGAERGPLVARVLQRLHDLQERVHLVPRHRDRVLEDVPLDTLRAGGSGQRALVVVVGLVEREEAHEVLDSEVE